MGHPRWPGVNEKTGDPSYDNVSRQLNTKLHKLVQRKLRQVNVVGRRRKKYLMTGDLIEPIFDGIDWNNRRR
ncbi:hypothetical protein FB472_0039 [Rhodoglobus vestalii]|uniref:Uncharacterized protein n=1 Tax=Rhodoglobus vestalii TaxID=193384 RepID=A0A8H2K443_9MICO|nr:hypothetical protein [Rhodoglobus vestalii]TQO18522.1 hypothetical protein FB472_0039 [Rhodoglobus vestalii]